MATAAPAPSSTRPMLSLTAANSHAQATSSSSSVLPPFAFSQPAPRTPPSRAAQRGGRRPAAPANAPHSGSSSTHSSAQASLLETQPAVLSFIASMDSQEPQPVTQQDESAGEEHDDEQDGVEHDEDAGDTHSEPPGLASGSSRKRARSADSSKGSQTRAGGKSAPIQPTLLQLVDLAAEAWKREINALDCLADESVGGWSYFEHTPLLVATSPDHRRYVNLKSLLKLLKFTSRKTVQQLRNRWKENVSRWASSKPNLSEARIQRFQGVELSASKDDPLVKLMQPWGSWLSRDAFAFFLETSSKYCANEKRPLLFMFARQREALCELLFTGRLGKDQVDAVEPESSDDDDDEEEEEEEEEEDAEKENEDEDEKEQEDQDEEEVLLSDAEAERPKKRARKTTAAAASVKGRRRSPRDSTALATSLSQGSVPSQKKAAKTRISTGKRVSFSQAEPAAASTAAEDGDARIASAGRKRGRPKVQEPVIPQSQPTLTPHPKLTPAQMRRMVSRKAACISSFTPPARKRRGGSAAAAAAAAQSDDEVEEVSAQELEKQRALQEFEAREVWEPPEDEPPQEESKMPELEVPTPAAAAASQARAQSPHQLSPPMLAQPQPKPAQPATAAAAGPAHGAAASPAVQMSVLLPSPMAVTPASIAPPFHSPMPTASLHPPDIAVFDSSGAARPRRSRHSSSKPAELDLAKLYPHFKLSVHSSAAEMKEFQLTHAKRLAAAEIEMQQLHLWGNLFQELLVKRALLDASKGEFGVLATSPSPPQSPMHAPGNYPRDYDDIEETQHQPEEKSARRMQNITS